jgi:hypothetical protein
MRAMGTKLKEPREIPRRVRSVNARASSSRMQPISQLSFCWFLIYMEKRSSKTRTTARASSKRQLINTGTDKRFVRRNAKGQIKESDDVGRSLAADRRTKAKSKVTAGQGDKGDAKRKTSKSKSSTKSRALKTKATATRKSANKATAKRKPAKR